MGIFFIIALVFLFIIVHWKQKNMKTPINNSDKIENYIEEFVKNENVKVSYYATFTNSDFVQVKYVVDDINKNIIFLVFYYDSYVNNYIIPFDEIVSVKAYKDDDISGGVERAVIGDLLAGGIGAIVGATTAKKFILSYRICIITTNISIPSIKIELLDKRSKVGSDLCRRADCFFEDINASIQSILMK